MASNLKKDLKINEKDVKSNKEISQVGLRGQSRTKSPYVKYQEQFDAPETHDKLSQFTILLDSWVEKYDDYRIIYTISKQGPVVQIQVVNPIFKKVHSSKFNELRIEPLANLGITATRNIQSDTYYYNILL